jgi:predicted amidohydrolase
MSIHNKSRRNFLKKSALTTGVVALGSHSYAENSSLREKYDQKLRREVWISAISQMGLQTESSQLMMEEILQILENAKFYNPDVICLPEVFPTSNIEKQLDLGDKLKLHEKSLMHLSDFAGKNKCYVICPIYTSENGKVYNAAVILDREGQKVGEYRKIHLTEGEIEWGLTPGPLDPPVFKTDFGIIGAQICFDIEWDDGWTKLQNQGAEIVFWPSAFAGGQAVNFKAIQHKYVIATSTRKNTAKLCDITGEVIAQTGIWDKNIYCGSVNLEKAFLHTWPYVRRFDEIRKKYGRKVKITTFHEEEWSIIESLSPEIFVADIIKEFDLETYEKLIKDSEEAQIKARNA